MNTTGSYLAVFLGSKDNPRMKEWMSLPEAERKAKEIEGIAAWKAWAEQHHGVITTMGGPLGKTKKVSAGGVEDTANALSGFTIVTADSHEAAARLFENHPHFAIFPGDRVEIMPILTIPGA